MIDLLCASKMNDEATRCGGRSDEKSRTHTHVKRFVHGAFFTLTNIHTKHKFQICLLNVVSVCAMLCHHTTSYHAIRTTSTLDYLQLFLTLSPSRPPLNPVAANSVPTFSTSKHAFTSFYSDLAVDFISSSFFFCCRVFRLCWESCVFFSTSFSFILRACGCIQIWNRKSCTAQERERERKKGKTMKLLENLLCESEWVCAFSIKFNKHTKWVEPKSSGKASKTERETEGKKRKQFNKIHLFPYCQISLLCF